MSYGLAEYAAGLYAGSRVQAPPSADTRTALSIEVAFTTGALETPAWEDITADVRFWDVQRGRSRELERFQPGRATIVLGNLSRQYDAVYADGPYFGNLRPMRRVRIRETFNGVTYPVFDGFVDGWKLDYPSVGKDATATLTATDAIKIFARTDLPVSVYHDTVTEDAPAFWWRLDEGLEEGQQERVALNSGSVGTAGNGTYVGSVNPGAARIVAYDPGTSLETLADTISSGLPPSGVDIPSSEVNFLARFNDRLAFTVEGWARPQEDALGSYALFQRATSPSTSIFYMFWFTVGGSNTGQFTLNVGAESINSGNGSAPPGFIYHWVARFTPSGGNVAVSLWLNGTEVATGTFTGTPSEASIDLSALGRSGDANNNWSGQMSNVAVYLSALSDERIAAHYAAGTSPWQDDQPDDRLGRILDLSEWPALLRELDAGNVALQSAATSDQTALEHLQKVAETEFGLLFIDRAGNVRFIDRASQAARTPGPTVYGDGTGEVGYRSIRPDDGDEVIRNQATISRLNGVAQTATGTTVDEFGRFQYTLDGLLHRLDSYSATYAQFVVDEYENPRRRIVELTIGPVPDGDEALYYPAMLGPELGDAIDVTFTPQGLGDPFEQTCVVEGIMHSSAPGRNRTTTFTLSPEFTETLF